MQLAPRSEHLIPHSLSTIQAGPAAEVCDSFAMVDLNRLLTGDREGFVIYEVTGDSGAPHILPGHLVIVDTWLEPREGDWIAAEVDGLVAVKKFHHTRNGLYLVSQNPKYPPRKITEQNSFRVIGVITAHVGVHRHMAQIAMSL